MNAYDYLDLLEIKFQKYFDVSRNMYILDNKIDMFAVCNIVNSRTFITKNDIVDSYENNEYCFIKVFDSIDSMDIIYYCDFLKEALMTFVKPKANHMNSFITGVIICDDLKEEVIDLVKKFKYSKSYKFYLYGWSEIRLILIDVKSQRVITNKPGKKVIKVYQFTS